MKGQLLINGRTRKQVEQFLEQPNGALLLGGAVGAGKNAVALQVAEKLLGGSWEELMNKGRLLILPAEAGIDDIRGVIREVGIKAASCRAVIINNAHKLGHEAQNALLKTLEELPPNTYFIISTSSPNGLLATIRSRAVTIAVKPVSLDEAKNAFTDLPESEIERAWLLSEGLAAQLTELLLGEAADLKRTTEAAKEFLGLDSYHRLLFLDKYASERENLILFLNGLKRILKAASLVNAQKNNTNALNRLTASRRLVMGLLDQANSNASTKLINLQLAVSLKV